MNWIRRYKIWTVEDCWVKPKNRWSEYFPDFNKKVQFQALQVLAHLKHIIKSYLRQKFPFTIFYFKANFTLSHSIPCHLRKHQKPINTNFCNSPSEKFWVSLHSFSIKHMLKYFKLRLLPMKLQWSHFRSGRITIFVRSI